MEHLLVPDWTGFHAGLSMWRWHVLPETWVPPTHQRHARLTVDVSEGGCWVLFVWRLVQSVTLPMMDE